MSARINSKVKGFSPLNNRKSVGQTYGERRASTQNPSTESSGWLQKAKDFFSGGIIHQTEQFSNGADRYEGKSGSPTQMIVGANKRVESGIKQNKVTSQNDAAYDRFLSSVIQFYDAKKKA